MLKRVVALAQDPVHPATWLLALALALLEVEVATGVPSLSLAPSPPPPLQPASSNETMIDCNQWVCASGV